MKQKFIWSLIVLGIVLIGYLSNIGKLTISTNTPPAVNTSQTHYVYRSLVDGTLEYHMAVYKKRSTSTFWWRIYHPITCELSDSKGVGIQFGTISSEILWGEEVTKNSYGNHHCVVE